MRERALRIVSVIAPAIVLGLGFAAICTSPRAAAAQAAQARYVEGEVIVKLREAPALAGQKAMLPGTDRAARLRALRDRFGLRKTRALAGMARGLAPGLRGRLEARAARAGRSPQLAKAEQALAGLSRVVVAELEEGEDVEAMAAALSADPEVEYAHPNYIAEALFVPNDPFWSTAGSWGQAEDDLWGLKKIQADQAWDTTFGAGVVVAVVDSGVDFGHPDLAANAWVNLGHGASPPEIPNNGIDDDNNGYIDDVNGFDFVRSVDGNGDGDYNDPEDTVFPDPIDENGHGTHVSGTIAAVGNNAIGVIGVAPQAQIMGVRGLDANGSGPFDRLATALVYAAVNGADVINNSWGCGFCPSIPIIEDAVRVAHDLDAVVVFSAGNSSDQVVRRSPQNMSETLVVSALTPTDDATSFTSFGPLTDVGAPGGGIGPRGCGTGSQLYNILSLKAANSVLSSSCPDLVVPPGGDYFRLAGTSMAAPHASGVAALLRAYDPTLTNEKVRQILRLASDPIPTSSPFLGYGRVNAQQVLTSTLNVEVLLETPTVANRQIEEPTVLSGFARGPNLQSVQVLVGPGEDPAQFLPVTTTWDPITGSVSATVDATDLPDGFALARLEASDGSQVYTSTVGLQVNNVHILSPLQDEVVQGQIDVVVDVGSSMYLQRVEVTFFNRFTGQTEVLLDTTDFSNPVFTIPFDTTATIDTTDAFGFESTIQVRSTFDVNGETVVSTDSVAFDVDNDRISSPARGALFTDPSPFNVDGTVLHDPVELQVHDGSAWVTVAALSAGPFSVPFDPAAYVDLDAQSLVVLRLVGDIDGDAVLADNEQTEVVQLYIDTALAPGWPQQTSEPVLGITATMGDIDGDGDDELVTVPSGDPISFNFFGLSFMHDPQGTIQVYDGAGNLDAAIAAGAQQFQEPVCATYAALHDLDGLPGKEILWTSYGQIAALRYDGTPPAGFSPDVFNDGQPHPEQHSDPNYTELFPCRPSTPFSFNTPADGVRILQSTRRNVGGQQLESKVLLFDASGAVVGEVDRGPGRISSPQWAVADTDFDLQPEIVTTRVEPLGPNGERDVTLLVYDALTLALEMETTLTQTSLIAQPLVGDIDGDNDREIVVAVRQHPPVGQTGQDTQALLAFNHDGTPVAGFSHTADQLGVFVLGNVDADPAAEVAVFESVAGQPEVALLDYDAAGQQLQSVAGWPAPIDGVITSMLIANIDADPAPELIYHAIGAWLAQMGTTTLNVFQHYFVSALDLDGTPWQGGWRRSLRGQANSIAVGDLDGGAGPELAVTYPIVTALRQVGEPEFLHGEVLVYPMAGAFNAPWSHVYGNAQQSAATRAQCQDGADNDDDALIDDSDPQCTGPLDPAEACGLGPELLLVLPPLYWFARRRQSRRNA